MSKQFFTSTFQILYSNQRKFERDITSKKLTASERKILKSYFLYKKGRHEEMLKMLDFRIEDEFLLGIKFYLKGLVQNHISKYRLALLNLEKSFKLLSEQSEFFAPYPLIIMGLTFANKKETVRLESVVLNLKKLNNHKSPFVKYSYLQLKCILYTQQRKFSKAKDIIASFTKSDDKYSKKFIPSFILIELNIYIIQKKYNKCFELLKKYNKKSGFVSKENYRYISILLEHLAHGQKIYVYQRDFQGHVELYGKLCAIKELSLGNIEAFKQVWGDLRLNNPELYLADYRCSFKGDLFEIALDNHRSKLVGYKVSVNDLEHLSTKVEKVLFILEASNKPVSKYEIIDLLWPEENFTEQLEVRVRNTIREVRKKFGVVIKSSHGTYQLLNSFDADNVA